MSEMQKLAAPCRRIPLSVNSSTQRPVIPDDPETELQSGELPELVAGETVVFCFSFLNPDGTAVVFSGGEVFEFSGDSDYNRETGLMFYAGPGQMNLAGDWDEADPAKGKIALRVNCNTENFIAKLGDQKQLPVFLEVRMTAADAVTRSILLRTTATALNTIHTDSEPPEEIRSEYYTAAQTESRLNSKAEAEHNHACSQIEGLAAAINGQIAPVEQTLSRRINEKADSSHTHGQYANADSVAESISAAMPAGAVIAFAGSSAPAGFIACNGAAVSRTTYAALFAAIGTVYGAGDGSTTFNLPDLTDRFIQGSATAGTVHAAGLPDATGQLSFVRGAINTAGKGVFRSNTTGASHTIVAYDTSSSQNSVFIDFSLKNSNPVYGASTTVQPPALTMIYCIKY